MANFIDFLSLLAIVLGGVGVGFAAGARSYLLAFSFGTLISLAGLILVLVPALLLGLPSHSGLPVAIFVAAFLGTVGIFGRQRQYWHGIGLAAAAVSAAGLLKFGLRVGEWATPDSAGVIKNVVENFMDGSLSWSISRGLISSAMLSVSPSGQLLTMFFPLVFFALVALTGHYWKALSAGSGRSWVANVSFWAAWVLFFSAPIVQANVFYIGTHVVTALGLALMVIPVFGRRLGSSAGPLSSQIVILAAAVVTLSRPEGPLVVLVLMFFIATHAAEFSTTLKKTLMFSGALSGMVAAAELYLSGTNIDEGSLNLLLLPVTPMLAAAALAFPIGISASDYGQLWRKLFWIVLGGAFLYFLLTGVGGIFASVANLFFGAGRWGTTLVLVVVMGGIALFARLRVPGGALLEIAGAMLLLFHVLKAIDAIAFARIGPGDSINRMVIHLLPLLALGLASQIEAFLNSLLRGVPPRWVQFPQGKRAAVGVSKIDSGPNKQFWTKKVEANRS